MSETIDIAIEGRGILARVNDVHFPVSGPAVRVTLLDCDCHLANPNACHDASGQPHLRKVFESPNAGWPDIECDVALFEIVRTRLERTFGKRNLSNAQLETIRSGLAKIQHLYDEAAMPARSAA